MQSTELNTNTVQRTSGQTPQEKLTLFLEETLAPLGYELVAIEVLNHREKSLRIFIDSKNGIGIEDCVKVTQELDQPLEGQPDVEAIFKGPYELEVSSPGIERPLRKPSDYVRFAGQIGRLSTFRALTADETLAAEYSAKNPKQKNFYGILRGFENENASVLFGIIPEDGTRETKIVKKGAKKKKEEKPADAPLKHETVIRIPLELISKAHLEPEVIYPDESEE
jgi:ribosome maturation factor RimP